MPIIPRFSQSSKWSLALSEAFHWHAGQVRKNSGLPYVIHCIEVAHVIEQMGFNEHCVIAAMLHDTLEDTAMPADRIRLLFGGEVLEMVMGLSETKLNADGKKRPWIDRKRDHLRSLQKSSVSVRAIALADQWHNLRSVMTDWTEGDGSFWKVFNASPADFANYHDMRCRFCDHGEIELKSLVKSVQEFVRNLHERLENEYPEVRCQFRSEDWTS